MARELEDKMIADNDDIQNDYRTAKEARIW